MAGEEEMTPCSEPGKTYGVGFECPNNSLCNAYWEGPKHGIISFDNIGYMVLIKITFNNIEATFNSFV